MNLFKMALLSLCLSTWTFSLQGQTSGGQPRRMEQARPWLGVAIDVGPRGVLVKEVIVGTPAQDSGLKAGDQITAVSDVKVSKPAEMIEAVRNQGVGTVVTIAFIRDNKPLTKKIKLVAKPDELEMLRSNVVGKVAPTTTLELIPGNGTKKLDEYKGQVALVEFWTTWCPACRATHERLSALARATKDKGLVVLAISNESKEDISSYVEKLNPNFLVLRDKDDTLHKELRVSAIPMILVIDKKGIVRFATMGGGSNLEEAIQKAESLAKEP